MNTSHDNQMEISDREFNIPWKNMDECEELIKYLLDHNCSSIKRCQLLIQLQWLTNLSDEHCSQLCKTLLKCCSSKTKNEFLNNLNRQYNTSFVLLSILIKNRCFNDDFIKLISLLDSDDGLTKNLFQMKIKQIKCMIKKFEELKLLRETNRNLLSDDDLTVENMLNIFNSTNSVNDWRIEKHLKKYFKINNQHEDKFKHLLMNLLVQAENKLSEPTVGMILDQLEKIDSKSSK